MRITAIHSSWSVRRSRVTAGAAGGSFPGFLVSTVLSIDFPGVFDGGFDPGRDAGATGRAC
jgi:hypothetical protein